MATVLERVKRVVVDTLRVEEPKVEASSRFKEDLGADSLGLTELIMAFEEELSPDKEKPLEISDDEAQGLQTIQDVVGYLKSKGIADEE